jgi:hypothetical protein
MSEVRRPAGVDRNHSARPAVPAASTSCANDASVFAACSSRRANSSSVIQSRSPIGFGPLERNAGLGDPLDRPGAAEVRIAPSVLAGV